MKQVLDRLIIATLAAFFLCMIPVASYSGTEMDTNVKESDAFTFSGEAAQNIRIRGLVIAMPENEALAYVNIGIPGTSTGTVSNERGEFTLNLSRDLLDEVVVFSALGYHTEERTIRELFQSSDRNVIRMQERTLELGEVGISASRLEDEFLGLQEVGFNWMSAGFEEKSPGFELAVKMQARRYPSILQHIRFYVNYNPGRSAIIRINVYENNDGVPGRNVVTENIIFRTTQTHGWVRLNMEPYRVVVQDDFFVSLEWVENLEGDGNIDMYFAGKRLSEIDQVMYTRKSRHDEWLPSDRLGVVLGTMVIN